MVIGRKDLVANANGPAIPFERQPVGYFCKKLIACRIAPKNQVMRRYILIGHGGVILHSSFPAKMAAPLISSVRKLGSDPGLNPLAGGLSAGPHDKKAAQKGIVDRPLQSMSLC